MTDDLERRVEDLELAVLALGIQEFGDLPGHPFRGNQHTGGGNNEGYERVTHGPGPIQAQMTKDAIQMHGVENGAHLNRAQKLLNYEKMHGTKAMLDKMTPAEREAHIRSGAGAVPVDLTKVRPPRPDSATAIRDFGPAVNKAENDREAAYNANLARIQARLTGQPAAVPRTAAQIKADPYAGS